MSYNKVLVDNPSCSRRFHVTYDDSYPNQEKVELRCPFCEAVVFARDNHPPAKIARQENMVQTAELSDDIVTNCQFKDGYDQNSPPPNK